MSVHFLELRQLLFQPPFCTNEKCLYHYLKSSNDFWSPYGWRSLKTYPYQNRRFRCKHCKRVFSYQSFRLTYREKIKSPGLNFKIFFLKRTACSNREIARELGYSEHLVRERVFKLGVQALLQHAKRTENLLIRETLAYDGCENFARSQYEPNHIQHMIGRDSLFIVDFNHVPLNRKGRTSQRQKNVLSKIEKKEGRFNPRAIRLATKEIFERISERKPSETKRLIIHMDQHFQYRRVLERDIPDTPIQAIRTSSKETRNFQNNLFAVNHTDLLLRKQICSFTRETISFTKTHIGMILHYALFMSWKNYMRTQFIKKHKRRPKAHTQTPAMAIGLCSKPLKFHEFFNFRLQPTQIPSLNREWTLYAKGQVPHKRII